MRRLTLFPMLMIMVIMALALFLVPTTTATAHSEVGFSTDPSVREVNVWLPPDIPLAHVQYLEHDCSNCPSTKSLTNTDNYLPAENGRTDYASYGDDWGCMNQFVCRSPLTNPLVNGSTQGGDLGTSA